jgi:hypothetical protein
MNHWKLASLSALSILLGNGAAHADVARYASTHCNDAGITCWEVQKGETWETLWPEATERDLAMRVNRMNIRLRPGMIAAVPSSKDSGEGAAFQPFPAQIDLENLAWGAFDAEGRLLKWGPASGGKDWCPDIDQPCQTPAGEYSVSRKGRAGCKSGKFPIPTGGAPMPYCMYFHGGYAIHGSPEVPGYRASHGCVRVFPEDARWLNDEFVELPNAEEGTSGTKVLIR